MRKAIETKVNYPEPGKYIVAVSGGVDSMSLLYLLANHAKYELVVAHFDHGMRVNSHLDMELVHKSAKSYGLEFLGERVDLGLVASEGKARNARYQFLDDVCREYGASAIVTAHHLDDRIETMALNKQRGAGWWGLSPLRETPTVKRPLLKVWKEEIVEYAREKGIDWREDETNQIAKTPRNYLRAVLSQNRTYKDKMHTELKKYDSFRDRREAELKPLLSDMAQTVNDSVEINRSGILSVDNQTARDVLFLLLQLNFHIEISRQKILRLEHFIKTAHPGKKLPLSKDVVAIAKPKHIAIEP